MRAVVKTPHTEIIISGLLPDTILRELKKEYGHDFKIIDDDDKHVDVFVTSWYNDIKSEMTPGDYLKVHRERMQLTQAELGKKLGGLHRQHISNMERGVRPISQKTANALAKLFEVDFVCFLTG